VAIEAPTDLRDMVWLPAHLEFSNGGETMALIPTRYPGSETSEDGAIVLARKTIWEERGADTFLGLGQRVLATDFGELSILDLRELRLAATSQAQA
jgi:type VI secretion system protein ImpE